LFLVSGTACNSGLFACRKLLPELEELGLHLDDALAELWCARSTLGGVA